MRARSDSAASSTCGSTMRPTSQMAAGANRSSSASRARDANGSPAALPMAAARAKAHSAPRIETESNDFFDGEIGEASGLRQRDPDLRARLVLANEHRGK